LFFFSSDGHAGYGGLDLHCSILEEGNITAVTHLDSSINFTVDDFWFFLKLDKNTGYFSSNKNGAQKDDIYGFTVHWRRLTLISMVLANTTYGYPSNGQNMLQIT
jgi:hypothetical protein